MTLHWAFLRREALAGWRQLSLFLLCVVSAVLAVAVVGGWRYAIEAGMARDSRQTTGGDVVAFSTFPFSTPLLQALRPYRQVTTQEMYTVAADAATGKTLFSKLKSVEPGYPLYGDAPLASGGDLHAALKRGLVVEPKVLQRLHLKVGDRLKIGERVFPIVDVCLKEPDRPLGLFGISARIFMASDQLASTGLVARSGSYVERRVQIRLDKPEGADKVAELLRHSAIPDQERVETWQHQPQSIRRFVDNFFLFLDLVAAFTVALGGLGMQGTLRAWLRGRRPTLAIVRTLGATSAWANWHYSLLVAGVTLLGVVLGLGVAGWLLHASGEWLARMLPGQARPYLGVWPALQAAALGALVSAAFTQSPLRQIKNMRPTAIAQAQQHTGAATIASVLLITATLLALMTGQVLRAAACSAGLLVLVGVVWGAARTSLWGLRLCKPTRLDLRTGLRGLLSGGANTLAVVTVLGSALTVLFTLTLSEAALNSAWVEAMPPQAPNLIFFDIQPDQAKDFVRIFGRPIQLYPSLRVRLQEVDGRTIPRSAPRDYGEKDARREFRGSSLSSLDPDESLLSGPSLFVDGANHQQVSVLDTVAKVAGLKVGSQLTLTIQGVPTIVTVSSLRHVVKESFRPTFDLLFPAEMIAHAPKTIFATARVKEADIGELQSKVAQAFPSIVSMDVSETIRLVAQKLTQLVTLTRLLLLLGALPGAIIIISAALASRLERQRESAYYKVVGASSGFVGRVVLWENGLLGLICSTLALTLSLAITWALCYWLWDVPFGVTPGIWGSMLLIPTGLVALIGGLLSIPVIRSRPAVFLRSDA